MMHAPRLFVFTSSQPTIIAQTMEVSHQLPLTSAKAAETPANAFQSHSPTLASLKSFGAMMVRQRKSRQKSSSITGTTRAAPATRTAIHDHMMAGEENAAVGSNAFFDGAKIAGR